jgi:S1-C subfamily serine protease
MAMAWKARVLMAVCVVLGVLPAPVASADVRAVFDQMSPSVVVIRRRGRDIGVNGRGLTYVTEIGSGVVVSAQGDVITLKILRAGKVLELPVRVP